MTYNIQSIHGDYFDLSKNGKSFSTVTNKVHFYSIATVYEISDNMYELLGMILENMQKVEEKHADD